MSKGFEFSREGLQLCAEYKDYKGVTIEHLQSVKEYIKDHPQIVPLTVAFAFGALTALLPITASAVAYKSCEAEIAEIAFKYVVGGF